MTVIAPARSYSLVGDPTELSGDQSELAERLLDATVTLVARWGVVKTTMGDIARTANCSRATAYRVFPGKSAMLLAAAQRELSRFSQDVSVRIEAAESLEDALVVAVTQTHQFLAGHEALQFVVANEPGVVLPFLGFGHIDALYATVRNFAEPCLARFLPPASAGWAGEWVCRVVFSYLFHPSDQLDLGTVDGARSLVRTFLLPALSGAPLDLTSSQTHTGS